jgi:hypothetical protein
MQIETKTINTKRYKLIKLTKENNKHDVKIDKKTEKYISCANNFLINFEGWDFEKFEDYNRIPASTGGNTIELYGGSHSTSFRSPTCTYSITSRYSNIGASDITVNILCDNQNNKWGYFLDEDGNMIYSFGHLFEDDLSSKQIT